MLLARAAPVVATPEGRLRLLVTQLQVELLLTAALAAVKAALLQAGKQTLVMEGQTELMVAMSVAQQPETLGKGKAPPQESLAKQPENCMPVEVAAVKEYTEAMELRELAVKGAVQTGIPQLTLQLIPVAVAAAGKHPLVVPAPAVKELRAAAVSCVSACTKTTPLRTC